MAAPTDPTAPDTPAALTHAQGELAPRSEIPPLRLVRGDATPEEVAALLTVLSAASGGEEARAPRHTSQWSSPARAVRRPVTPGPGAWRASAWPR